MGDALGFRPMNAQGERGLRKVTQCSGLAMMCSCRACSRSPPKNSGSTWAASTLFPYESGQVGGAKKIDDALDSALD